MLSKLKSNIPQYIARLQNLQAAVDDTADAILEAAQELTPSPWNPGPWARGVLVNAIYVSRSPGSADGKYTFSASLAAAKGSAMQMRQLNPGKYHFAEMEEFDQSIPSYDNSRFTHWAIVVNPMYYAGLIEHGGMNENGYVIAAQPFMTPVAVPAMPGFINRVKFLLK